MKCVIETEAFKRGYGDRMTGHEKDAPLNSDRKDYLKGYNAACKELRRPSTDWSSLRPDGTRYREVNTK